MNDAPVKQLFYPSGRIGRARFSAVALTVLLVQYLSMFIIAANREAGDLHAGEYPFLMLCATAPFAWLLFCGAVQRLRDMSRTWLFALPLPLSILTPPPFFPSLGSLSLLAPTLFDVLYVIFLALLPVKFASALPAASPTPPNSKERDGFGLCPAGHYNPCPFCNNSTKIVDQTSTN